MAERPEASEWSALQQQLEVALAERDQARTQQAALAEVLQAINGASGDFRPVFDLIIARATALCNATSGGLVSIEGNHALALAFRNTPKALVDYWATPQYVDPNTGMGQVLRQGRTIHHADMAATEPYRARAPMTVAGVELGGIRSFIMVPLVNERGVIGIFVISRNEVRPFDERQIALVESFAAQAMLAMENARRLIEQREALEQQTATAEVLEVINASRGNLVPVFDAMLEKAMRLCEAAFGIFGRFDGKVFEPAVDRGVPPELMAATRQIQSPPSNSGLGRIAAGESVVQLVDLANTDIYRSGFVGATALVDIAGAKTAIFVALRKERELLGVIVMYRREVRAFSDKQVALLQNFAAQAVIAMENARLINETRDALEQQIATAQVLQVISQSPTDVGPVLKAVVAAARRFCGAEHADIFLREGNEIVAGPNDGPISSQAVGQRDPLNRNSSRGVTILDGCTTHIPDIEALAPNEYPLAQVYARRFGFRATANAPMLRDGVAIGCVTLRKPQPGAFTPRQIQLMETFAAQAVIAIENARLFTELREALDQQTATAEVLSTINRSPGDLTPVFDTILAKAMALCDAVFGILNTFDGERYHTVATLGVPEDYARFRQENAPDYSPASAPGRLIAGEDIVQIADMADSDLYRNGDPNRRSIVDLGGARTLLNLALRREGKLLGMIAIYRQEVRPFTEQQVALVQSFAAQAVIAMENARLLSELRESLDQQTATSDILRVISQSPTDVQPVLEAVVKAARSFCGAEDAVVLLREGHQWLIAGHEGPMVAEVGARQPLSRQTAPGRAMLDGVTTHFPDISALDPVEFAAAHEFGRRHGFQAALAAPMLREGVPIGAIALRRSQPGAFKPRQVELLESFAAQAVIALENTRLFTELRQRTDDLTQSLDYQTATSELLEVISRSASDIQPVLDTLAESAARLCSTTTTAVAIRQGDSFRYVATRGLDTEFNRALRERRIVPGRDTLAGRVLLAGVSCHVADMTADRELTNTAVRVGGMRTGLAVPLMRDGEAIGVITLVRDRVEPFTERQISLIHTFADQAVIAMQNARLLSELRERTDDLTESLEYQTATSELLEVISRSTADVQPVLDTLLASACRLCGVQMGGVTVRRGDVLRYVATLGMPPEYDTFLRETPHPIDRGSAAGRATFDKAIAYITDVEADPEYKLSQTTTLGGFRSLLGVPLMREGEAIGAITIGRMDREPFTERQIGLVKTFADQAVIAIENARLLGELTRREQELRVTFDHMGDGVVMFDAGLKLASWNRNFQELLDIPDTFLAGRPGLDDYVRLLVGRGELGAGESSDAESQIARYRERANQTWSAERVRPDGRILEVRNNPVPGGGAVLIYSDITERKKAEAEIASARDAAEAALDKLKAAQANLVQSEKMATLGQLTAGIAHEIKNPLNFVNNFASLSVELLDELKEIAEPALATLDAEKRAELDETMSLLIGNLDKITEHGKRADGIVKSMLSHSRGGAGDWQLSDVNALVEEALNLAYHGARAQDKEFNVTLERDFARDAKPIDVVPQDVMRVFLNLFGNGFYAVNKRRLGAKQAGFRPTIKVVTRDLGDMVEVKVRDNGTGIAADVREKLFQPFFTTKPTGEGTGLGLSISYDIVTQQHGGTIGVESEPGNFTEFTICLPRSRRVSAVGRMQ